MDYFESVGAIVALPLRHTSHWDFLAELGERILRMQVKTSTCRVKNRWHVMISTHGGNQSWSGLTKRFDASRCDVLVVVVVVGDGRRWCIPSRAVGGTRTIVLGGPKYGAYEVDRSRPLDSIGGRGSAGVGEPGQTVNLVAQPE